MLDHDVLSVVLEVAHEQMQNQTVVYCCLSFIALLVQSSLAGGRDSRVDDGIKKGKMELKLGDYMNEIQAVYKENNNVFMMWRAIQARLQG